LKIKNKTDAFNDPSIRVAFFRPSITKDDQRAVINALKKPLLTDGPILQEFEKKFSQFTNAKYAIGVSNATSALQLSLKSLGIGKGDEVILPDMTFIATASSVLLNGAIPVLVDVEKDSMNISINSIKKNITKKTKAIIPVHFAGRVCDILEIMKIARLHRLFVIEDCAHAIGARYKNKHVGLFGDAGCFSFYPTKNITTIEGGMIITKSKKIFEYVKLARNHSIDKSLSQRFSQGLPWNYDVKQAGYNYRLDEIRSSLGINQLIRIEKLNLMRKKAYEYYNKKLKTIPGIETPTSSDSQDNVYHLYIIKICTNFGLSRNELYKKLLELGIRTSVHYKPLHKFTLLKKQAKISNNIENSKKLYDEILTLPFHPFISKYEQNYVIDSIRSLSAQS